MDQPKIKLLKLNIRLIVVAIVFGVIVAAVIYLVQNFSIPVVVKLRPFLGIDYYFISQGAEVRNVATNSAAEKAGIRAGDVISKVDGQDIDSASKILKIMAGKKVGDKLKLTIRNDDKEINVTTILQKWPDQ